MSFAVVVPAYNEEAGIEACCRAICTQLGAMPHRSTLVIVDDGSRDRTAEILASVASLPNLETVRHSENRGYGAALRTGIELAAREGYDYVLFMDSDLTNDPADLPRFAAAMEDGADVIKASRYVAGGGTRGVPRWRVALSVAGNAVARTLFGVPVRDCTNGFRAIRTSLLTRIDLDENGFALIMEELYRLRPLAARYTEVPVVLTTRDAALRPSVFSYSIRSLAKFLKYPVKAAWSRMIGATRSET